MQSFGRFKNPFNYPSSRRPLDFRDFRQSNYYIILISVYGYLSEGNLPITNMWTEFGEL